MEATFSLWQPLFGNLQMQVLMLTGDTTIDLKVLESASIILSTSERWDSLSRRWRQRKNVQNVSLFIIDELHLVGGEAGPTLEVVVSRARYVASQLERHVRIIGLGSSLANARDVGDWIGASPQNVFNFAPSVRPVPVVTHIHGFDMNHFGTRILSMAKPTFNAIMGHSSGKPCLIFTPSRKQAQLTAIDLMTLAGGKLEPPEKSLPILQKACATIKDPALAQTLEKGVAFFHNGLALSDRDTVKLLYQKGLVLVLVLPFSLCWSAPGPAHLVVIMDTVYYEGREHRYIDYPTTDILQMTGLACRPRSDDSGVCVLLCHSSKKEYLSRCIRDPLPVESHLDRILHDVVCAEVVTKTIESKQDAIDYLTWTFYYRRLTQNPNYYNLQGVSNRHLSDHLSELVENIVTDLEESKCIVVEDEVNVSPLNLGLIASYYYIQYTTVELFASSVTEKTKIKGVLEIISASTEFSLLTVRHGEDKVLKKMAQHLPQALSESAKVEEASTKALILLQSHLSRNSLSIDLQNDLRLILASAVKLLQALVDVVSSQGWLKPALATMEVSQMIVQGLWSTSDAVLLQIPHFNSDTVARCRALENPVESVFDLLELEDDVRNDVLQMAPEDVSDVALFCNSYPNVELSFECDSDGKDVEAGDSVLVSVALLRDTEVASNGVRSCRQLSVGRNYSRCGVVEVPH